MRSWLVKQSPLARRLVVITLGCSTVLAIFFTAMQLLYAYSSERSSLNQRIEDLASSAVPALERSLWILDEDLTHAHLEGIARVTGVISAHLITPDLQVEIAGDDAGVDIAEVTEFPLVFTDRGNRVELGVLTVASTDAEIKSQLAKQLLVLFLTNLVKTFLMSLIILLIFQRLVGRHLRSLSNFARNFNPARPSRRVALERRGYASGEMDELDELDELDAALQQMVLVYSEHIAQIQRADRSAQLACEMQQLNERQKETFSVISHELRTPIAGIEMLVANRADLEAQEIKQIHGLSNDLLTILDDVRMIATPDSVLQSKFEVLGAIQLVQRVYSTLEPLADSYHVKLTSEVSDEAQAWLMQGSVVRRCIANLVKNSILHAGGTRVQLSQQVQSEREGWDRVTWIIEDDGRGLTESEQASVFDAFQRGRSQSEGTGLGLFIVKQALEAMGGSVTYQTGKLGGARFELKLLLERAPDVPDEVKPAAVAIKRNALQGLRILLAEDDQLLGQFSEKLLMAQGAQVKWVADGQAAWDQFQLGMGDIDLVLTDLMMPGLTGIELTQKVKATRPETKVIALTAAVMGKETDELLAAGADQVLSKPFKIEKLTAALEDSSAVSR